MESLFLEIAGLPIHPLVVHAAVITIPVAAIALLLGVVLYRRRPGVLGVAVVLTWVATLSAFVATQSGEALAGEIGITAAHQQWGELIWPVTITSALVATATWFIRRRGWRVASLVGTLATLVSVPVLLVLVVLAGHSGADATWGSVLAARTATDTTPSSGAAAAAELPAPIPEEGDASGSAGITLAEVSTHATVDDCWVVVDGTVYDLSGYATAHPGGAAEIVGICGTDATDAFRNQHGSQGSPNRTLAGFEIGPLSN